VPAEIALPSITVPAHRTLRSADVYLWRELDVPDAQARREAACSALLSSGRWTGRVASRRGDGMGWDGMACGYCVMAVHSVWADDPSAAGDGAGGQVRARAPRRQPRAIRLPQGAVGVHLDVRALPIQGALRRNPNASQRRQRQAKAEEKPNTTKQKRRRGARQLAKFMGTHRLWLCIRWVVNRSFEQQAKAESPRGAGRGGAGRTGRGGAGRGGAGGRSGRLAHAQNVR
jgi:hypothetical protein